MRKLLTLLVLLWAPGAVFAQSEAGGPPPNVRMRIGPLFINPTLSLGNAGVDTNVFNVADTAHPDQDFTITISPATDLWMRLGRSWINGTIREDLVWFQKFANQRAANNSYKLKWIAPLNRITFTPAVSYADTRSRPGYEIDARVQQFITDYSMVVEVRALSKTFFGVRADRNILNFAADAAFNGINLQDTLTQTNTTEALTLRHQVTPLTNLTLEVAKLQNRFPKDPNRDSDATTVTGNIRFDQLALIKGDATVGYENFTPLGPGIPGFAGATAAVDLSYVAFGTTKVSGTVNRSVQYSYDVIQPYYVQTGVAASVSQQLFGPLDVVVRGTTAQLAYRNQAGAEILVGNRVDRVQGYGGGIGYHLGRDMRIGVNLDQQRRLSDVPGTDYSGLRYGVAVTYGQ